MAKRLLIVAALVALLDAAPANGQGYPPGSDEFLTISDATLLPGQAFTIRAGGFAAGAAVSGTFFSEPVELTTGTADAGGNVTLAATVPDDAALGSHTILVSGEGADGEVLELTAAVEVVAAGGAAAGAGAGADLARTGSSTTLPLTGVAAVLLAVGAAFFLTARRRRAHAVTTKD